MEMKSQEEEEEKIDVKDREFSFTVTRNVYNYEQFNDAFREYHFEHSTVKEAVKTSIRETCSRAIIKNRALDCIPLVGFLKEGYVLTDFVGDLIAGITMCIFHIPQGLAYGMLAGLEPVNGLYTSLIPVIVYAVFGMSRHLSVGTFSLLCIMLSDVVENNISPYSQYLDAHNVTFLPEAATNNLNDTGLGNTTMLDNIMTMIDTNATSTQSGALPFKKSIYVRLQVAIMATFLSAIINLILGFFQLGIAMRFMSHSMLRGFTTAAAFHVVTSQIPLLLGITPGKTTSKFKMAGTYYEMFKVIATVRWQTIVASLVCLVILYVVKEYLNPRVQKKTKIPIPIELILIVTALLISYFANLKKYKIKIVGPIPQGLPPPLIPDFGYIHNLIVESIPLAVVGATISMSLVKTYALKFDYRVDYNQEFLALGFSNLLGSFFQCFYACGALARCAVVVDAGMKSQIASLISCAGMLIVIMVLGPLFEYVPKCVLGAIIVISLKNMLKQVTELPTVWRISRIDFSVWVITALSVTILDVTMGLVIGFAYTIFSMVLRTQNPPVAILGRIADTELYKNHLVYPSAVEVPGLKIIRFDSPLNFANCDYFRDTVMNIIANAAEDETLQTPIHTVILDGSSWAYIDAVGVKAVKEAYKLLSKRGLRVLFAGVKESARSRFLVTDFFKEIRESMFFITNHDAVIYSLGVTRDEDFERRQKEMEEDKDRSAARRRSSIYRKSRSESISSRRGPLKMLMDQGEDVAYFDCESVDNIDKQHKNDTKHV